MKKRVALVSAFYPYRGGIAQFGANLYRALEGLDIVVDAYTFRRQYPKILFPGKTQLVENGDKADHIPAERIIDSINPLSYRTAAKKMEANNPQVLITQYWMTFFAPSFGFISKYFRQKRVKRISILHNVIPHEKKFFDTRANRYFLAQHDGFVVMSDAVLADLLLFKPDAKYIRIDHPSYDHFGAAISRQEALEALNLDLSKKYILFFGFIRKYKGLDVLIQAMKDLGEDIHLIIAGEAYGSIEDYLQQINDFGLQDRVHLYTDYITDEQVKVFFSAAAVMTGARG